MSFFLLISREHPLQQQGRPFWGIYACMRVARRVLSPGKGTMFNGKETVITVRRHPVRAPSHFARRCER